MKAALAVCMVMVFGLANASMTYHLSSQWMEGGKRFCKYSNGTVLNVGVSLCPRSIKG